MLGREVLLDAIKVRLVSLFSLVSHPLDATTQ